MEDKNMFRTVVFGGYQKEDVTDYIRSLENENETIRILANKEKNELKLQLEKEKAVSEELKNSLNALKDKMAQLEEQEKRHEGFRPTQAEPEDRPSPEETGQNEELLRKLYEDQKTILENQEHQAERLSKLQEDMHLRWQQELERLHAVWEEMRRQPDAVPDERTEEAVPQASSGEQEEAVPESVDSEKKTEERSEEIVEEQEEAVSAEREEPTVEEQEEPALEECQGTREEALPSGYGRRMDNSMDQARKRAAELLSKLDSF